MFKTLYKKNKKIAITKDKNVVGVFYIKDNILVEFCCFAKKSLAREWVKDLLK